MTHLEKKASVIMISSLVMVFVLKLIATTFEIMWLQEFFGIDGSTNPSFLETWFQVGTLIILMILISVLFADDIRPVMVGCSIVLAIYGFLQLMALSMTVLFAGAGYDDGYVMIDLLLYLITCSSSLIPSYIMIKR